MKLQFLPAGKLTIRCLSAKGLRNRDTLGRQDPYVIFTTSGECHRIQERTHVDQDGGTEPTWDCDVEMRVVDHHELWIECYDHDAIGSDDLIGKCKLSLLPVFKRGLIDTWVTIKEETEWGKPKPAGDIHLIFEFEAPPGIRYPQHAPGIDSFDEKDRISKVAEELKAKQIAELDAGRKDKAELADQILDRQRAAKRVRTTEFTDGEIEAAFKFIDLDHNGYVGAAEIRHVLVCMGELITDEEVDMMIKMVDSDGDGQVSFTEFYNVVTDPDPAHTDFVKMAAQEEEDPAQSGDPGQMDAKAHERHKEITLRNKKREMMEAFTVFVLCGTSSALQFGVSCGLGEVFLSRVYRSEIVSEFGPLSVEYSPVDVPAGRERRRPGRSSTLLLEVPAATPRTKGGLQGRLRDVLRDSEHRTDGRDAYVVLLI